MSYTVKVSAKIITWPLACACCGEQPDSEYRAEAERTTGKRVQRTTTKGWDIPYCSRCLLHKEKYEKANMWLVFGVVGGLIAGTVLWVVTGLGVGLLCGGLLIAGCSVAFRNARKEGQQLLKDSCSSHDAAISYEGWEGTVHTFKFESASYMQAFAQANAKKVLSNVRQG